MGACSFTKLLQLMDKQLDLDSQLAVYGHIDRCNICRDAIYDLTLERDSALYKVRSLRKPPVNAHCGVLSLSRNEQS